MPPCSCTNKYMRTHEKCRKIEADLESTVSTSKLCFLQDNRFSHVLQRTCFYPFILFDFVLFPSIQAVEMFCSKILAYRINVASLRPAASNSFLVRSRYCPLRSHTGQTIKTIRRGGVDIAAVDGEAGWGGVILTIMKSSAGPHWLRRQAAMGVWTYVP